MRDPGSRHHPELLFSGAEQEKTGSKAELDVISVGNLIGKVVIRILAQIEKNLFLRLAVFVGHPCGQL